MSETVSVRPKVLAIMQNQWFKDPERVRAIYERNPGERRELIARFLFMGCLTGRRLQEALGEEWCESITWEEASPEIGGHSSSRFTPDARHIARALEDVAPDVVLAFGADASKGLDDALASRFFAGVHRVFRAPHPAARGAGTREALATLRRDLDAYAFRVWRLPIKSDVGDRPTCRLGYSLLQCEVARERGDIKHPECVSCPPRPLRRMNPDALSDLVDLAREVAAFQTWEEMADAEDDPPLKGGALDETISRARNLLDNWGLHGE